MKRYKIILSSLLVAMAMNISPVGASQSLTVQVNGETVSTPPGIYVVDEQVVMVPFRWALEQQ